jgi:hypothetical protein
MGNLNYNFFHIGGSRHGFSLQHKKSIHSPTPDEHSMSGGFDSHRLQTYDKNIVQPEQKQVFAWMPAQHEHFVGRSDILQS